MEIVLKGEGRGGRGYRHPILASLPAAVTQYPDKKTS